MLILFVCDEKKMKELHCALEETTKWLTHCNCNRVLLPLSIQSFLAIMHIIEDRVLQWSRLLNHWFVYLWHDQSQCLPATFAPEPNRGLPVIFIMCRVDQSKSQQRQRDDRLSQELSAAIRHSIQNLQSDLQDVKCYFLNMYIAIVMPYWLLCDPVESVKIRSIYHKFLVSGPQIIFSCRAGDL